MSRVVPSMTICDDDHTKIFVIYRAIASASHEEHASGGAFHMRVRVCACECACVAFGRPPTELCQCSVIGSFLLPVPVHLRTRQDARCARARRPQQGKRVG